MNHMIRFKMSVRVSVLLATVVLIASTLSADRNFKVAAKDDSDLANSKSTSSEPSKGTRENGVHASTHHPSSKGKAKSIAPTSSRRVRNDRTSFTPPTDKTSVGDTGRKPTLEPGVAVSRPMLMSRSRTAAPAMLPSGFQESIVFTGLTNPTVVEFASDGRVFIAEKSGIIKVFDNLSDTTPTIFADLRTKVHNFWDRGLLGLALHPNFPTTPYVYVLYTYDAAIGGNAPRWGSVNGDSDGCPTPPGPTADGCVVSGRLSRLQAAGNVMTGPEQVLIEDWCQQYPSHSIGSLAFGADGALYVSGGDGASFTFVDFGQDGSPVNPCSDPNLQGGSLRSQDLQTSGDPVSLDGAILRVSPDTGAALPDNPFFSNPDPNARRIIAYGLRNPFRITTRPGTNEVWVGDVGWSDWEEINRIVNPLAGVLNFGWPCYEGQTRQSGYDSTNLPICENLYGQTGVVTPPIFTYNHGDEVVPGETIPSGTSSISGLAFYGTGSYPATYQGALFFADYSRKGIWVMFNPTPPPPPPVPPMLVAAYGFNEGLGTSAADTTGHGHTGAISGATWSTQGKFGNALSFDGVNDWVTVTAGPLLDLTTAMTLEAWVFPTTTNGVRDIIVKEGSSLDVYNLYARNWQEKPESNIHVEGDNRTAEGPVLQANVWTHVAGTYDNSILRLYLNGVQVSSTAVTGSISASTGPLRIGGNSMWGEFFQGRIDEVRVYNRALSVAEIQSDMNSAVSAGQAAPAAAAAPAVETSIETFIADAAGPVQLKIGPGGDLFYVDFDGGTIRRVQYSAGNQPPTAVAQANPLSGAAPLTVNFDGTASSDPDAGDTLDYSWDLNGDGVFGDSTSPQASFLFNSSGAHNVSLRVTDDAGSTDTDVVVITVGNPPTAIIDLPPGTLTWRAGDVISFSGHATDPDQGTLSASALSWSLIIHHCPSNCHTHTVQDFVGVAGGSFTAPDHEYPSHLELRLTATDATGLTDTESVLLNPQTVVLTFESSPSGLQLVVGSTASVTPFNRTVIIGSNNSISATSPQTLGGQTYTFGSWSDGGAQSHNITAGEVAATYTANYLQTVTAFPTSTTVVTGTLSSGTAADLVSDNNIYYAVNSTTTGTRTAAWYGAFTGVSNSLSNLKLSYKGNNSRNSTQTVAIWNWLTSAWVQLDSRTVGTTEVAINNLLPPGTLADYVSGTVGNGELRVRIQAQATANLTNRGDVMSIVYDVPVGPPPPDTTPPVRANGAPTGTLGAGTTQTTLSLTTDENATCHYATVAGVAYGSMPNTFSPTGGTAHSTTVTGLSDGGSYNFFVRCQDGLSNANTNDFTISFSVAQPGVGLVAAYGFNEGLGTSTADASGNGHLGAISGATWSTLGKFGNALSFDGVNDWVTVNSTALLNFTAGTTLEAWVFPTTTTGVRDILLKEGSNVDIYNLYARNWRGLPESNVFVNGANRAAEGSALPANVWTHVAGTYDGATLRLYINGVQVATTTITGSIATSTGPLRVGGNSLWGEFFLGRIDEIRIYNRALSAAEIQADMAAPIN